MAPLLRAAGMLDAAGDNGRCGNLFVIEKMTARYASGDHSGIAGCAACTIITKIIVQFRSYIAEGN
jgi:hypothetical protein